MANHPIFAPTFHGDVTKVRSLLGDDPSLVSVRDAKNLTPLHVAASRGQHEVIQLLLDHGADISGPTQKNDWTPIVFASYRGHLDAVRVLIENGADVTRKAGDPIHFAGQRKHKEICRLLAAHGAIDDRMVSNDPILRALFRAAYSYDASRVGEILSTHPELISAKDDQGRTLLHEVCAHGDTFTARVLLKNGIDPALEDANGQTALDRARAHRQHAVVRLLDKHTANQ